jgi:hypothetical protein
MISIAFVVLVAIALAIMVALIIPDPIGAQLILKQYKTIPVRYDERLSCLVL